MRFGRLVSLALAAVFAALPAAAQDGAAGPNTSDTRLLARPALSGDRLAFVYAGDLWVAGLEGGGAQRITSGGNVTTSPGFGSSVVESSPVFSPDGKTIAFSANRDGNVDVYVVPAGGGVPKRLTWHPGSDLVQGFSPDGASVLFSSPRAVYTNRYNHLYLVPVAGGVEERLAIPHATRASYSGDGARIAYNPLSHHFLQWKRYRGGAISRIQLFDNASKAVEKIPQPAGGANDADPMWVGDTVYFRSDRDGEFNLYAYDTKSKAVRRLTNHQDYPVLSASARADRIAYEQAGWIHMLDAKSGTATRLKIGVAADLPATSPRWAKADKWIRTADLSPTGARIAVEYRGEIVTVPAEKGDVRNLTNTTGVHERSPVWSPDGTKIAYFSDSAGEYELVVADQRGNGKGERRYKISGAGYFDRLAFSPDSKKIAFTDNAWSLYWLDLASGTTKKVGTEYLYGPVKTLSPVWSPDSRWIAYTMVGKTYIQTLYAYSIEQDKSFPITDGLADAAGPVWDKSGKYLFFFSSTDAGPNRNWFSLQNQDMDTTRTIWMAVLRKDLPSPLLKESDEEKGPGADEKKKEEEKPVGAAAAEPAKEAEKTAGAEGKKKDAVDASKAPKVSIDFDGIAYRILDLPIPGGDYEGLLAGPEGQIFFLREADGKTALQRFDLKDRKTETLLPEVESYWVSADRKKLLWRNKTNWGISGTGGKTINTSEGKVKMDAIEVRVDPRAEWPQMFREAWRIQRDYFYDPGMHGNDWKAVHDRYAVFLPHLTSRHDLGRVIRWMCSELSVGHSYQGAGDTWPEIKTVPGGLLGADYAVENGRYRIKKVFGGLNWNPELRSPLTEPGVNGKEGEYLIAVDGRDVRPPANLYSFFENTAGKIVEITLGATPDGKGARTVQVVPVESEVALRNRDWVEGNLRKVEKATGGRVAYVYVPNTGGGGHQYFKRYFYPQAWKDAVIIDERHNGGGSLADYVIDILRKPFVAWWAMRYGADMKTPSASIQGPQTMIIDETAGSGGDLLPWMFHQYEMGTIVGKRTWGGLVGILGFPVLIDGGTVTSPNLAIWTKEGWIVENKGMPPDVEIEQDPAAVIAGRDPQLEKAIELTMKELEKKPVTADKRPPFKKVTAPVSAPAGPAS